MTVLGFCGMHKQLTSGGAVYKMCIKWDFTALTYHRQMRRLRGQDPIKKKGRKKT